MSNNTLQGQYKKLKQKQLDILKEQMRRRGLNDLIYLSKEILGAYNISQFHHEWARILDEFWRDPKSELLLILGPRGSLKCLPDNQEVLLENGEYIQIKELSVGDKICSLNKDLKTEYNPVLAIEKNAIVPIYRITTQSGREIEVSFNHPILQLGKWIEAQYLKKGDKVGVVGKTFQEKKLLVASSDIFWDKVIKVENIGKKMTYDIEVANTHNFAVSDIITHNTTIVSCNWVIQRILENPNIRILLTNEKEENAKKFLSIIRNHFENNQMLRYIYGDFVSKQTKWTEYEFTVSNRTKYLKEPTVMIGSIDKSSVSLHTDLIIEDDLQSRLNTQTKDQIDKVWQYHNDLRSILDPGGKRIIVGSRWDYNDIYSRIIASFTEKDKINGLPATEEVKRKYI